MIVWRIFDANDSFLRVHAFLESCCKHMQTSRNYACTRNNFFILHAHASIYRFSWARSRLLSCTLIHNGIQFLLIDIKRSSSPISTTPQFCNFLFAKSSTQSSNQGHLWGDCLSIIHAPTSTNKSKNVELFAVLPWDWVSSSSAHPRQPRLGRVASITDDQSQNRCTIVSFQAPPWLVINDPLFFWLQCSDFGTLILK